MPMTNWREILHLFAPFRPVAKQSVQKGINRKTGKAVWFRNARADKAHKELQQFIYMVTRERDDLPVLFPAPVRLDVICWMPRPKSKSAKYGAAKWPCPWHVSAPDCDNLMKQLKDSAEGLAFENDSQVCQESLCKRYADEHEVGWEFRVYVLKEKP